MLTGTHSRQTRGGKGKAEKARRDYVERIIRDRLWNLGMREAKDGLQPYAIETRFGKLWVNISFSQADRGGSYATVFTCFDEPKRVRGRLDCNPCSGKWNSHGGEIDLRNSAAVNAFVERVVTSIARILPEKGPPDIRIDILGPGLIGLVALTDRGRDWLLQNTQAPDWQWQNHETLIFDDQKYAADVIQGATDAGIDVST